MIFDMSDRTSISVSSEVRDRIRACKRGGEGYSELLARMVQQYEPDDEQHRFHEDVLSDE